MKKKVIALALSAVMAFGLVGCGGSGGSSNTESKLNVGMVTDAGTIDDKSFNEGTWNGIEKAQTDLEIASQYLKPAGITHSDYMKEIANLYDTGYKFIVTPGFKFETAIFEAQEKYKDAKFVILDGSPQNGDYNPVVAENTVSVFFAEHEAGFLAGAAAALELKEGDLGFIGGMEIPAVQKFNWGFQQGINYANENLGTKVTIKEENVVYQGGFEDAAAGQAIAAQMYDRGVKAIFSAAGGVGTGVITEAKQRATNGEEVWVIGVDVDQYTHGIYDTASNKSVILTSALKELGTAAYDIIKAELDGSFPGGQTLIFDSSNNGIGLPDENPNLSAETMTKVDELFKEIQDGKIKVVAEQGDLIK